MLVSEVMRRVRVITVSRFARLSEAQELMDRHHVRHLPVVNGGRLVGLVTERDLLRALAELRDFDAAEQVIVSEVMVEAVVTIHPDAPLLDAVHRMTDQRLGCLPVVDAGGRVVGILTATDLLRYAEERAEEEQRREVAAEYDADA